MKQPEVLLGLSWWIWRKTESRKHVKGLSDDERHEWGDSTRDDRREEGREESVSPRKVIWKKGVEWMVSLVDESIEEGGVTEIPW